MTRVVGVLGFGGVGAFAGFWTAVLTCPSGAMSIDAAFEGLTGGVVGAILGTATGVLIFT